MFPRCLCVKVLKPNLSCQTFSTTNLALRNHYESLGITPRATQTDIKSAYYKLSMLYHPDKNKGSADASKKFQDISAAYEVLGNFKLRKLYDKGLLHTAGHHFAQADVVVEEEEDPQAKFYRSRLDRRTAPSPSGRTPIYDFDEWSRAHYGATFERANRAREKYKQKMAKIEQDKTDVKTEMVIMGVMCFMTMFLILSYFNRSDYDVVEERKSIQNSK